MYKCQNVTATEMSFNHDIVLMTERGANVYYIDHNCTTEDETV